MNLDKTSSKEELHQPDNTKRIQNLRLPKESKGQIVSLFSTLSAELGGDTDKAESVQFKDRYERHKADYIEDGSKFGGQIPFIISDEVVVGNKRVGAYHQNFP